MLADHKDSLGLDNVIFFKRTPLSDERGKVESLIRKGAKIVSTADALSEFHQLGFNDATDVEQAYADSDVIIDCTPSGKMIIGIMFIHLLIRIRDSWHKDLNMDLVLFCMGNK